MYTMMKYLKKTNRLISGSINGITIDLGADFEEILNQRLLKEGILRKDFQDSAMDYFRLQCRLIENRPRKIKKAKGFSCPKGYESALLLIEKIIQIGGNLHPFMTRNIKRLSNEDLMLSDWGIYHLHLSDTIDTEKNDGFMKRSDKLLMVRIDPSTVYFVTIVSHNEKNVWTLKKYIQIIHDNWPETIARSKLPGISPVEHISEKNYSKLRKAHISTITELDDGTCYALLGGGYSSDGTSTNAVRIHDYWYRILYDAERVLIQTFPIYMCREDLKPYFPDSKAEIRLIGFENHSLSLIEVNTNIIISMHLEGNSWSIQISSPNIFLLNCLEKSKLSSLFKYIIS